MTSSSKSLVPYQEAIVVDQSYATPQIQDRASEIRPTELARYHGSDEKQSMLVRGNWGTGVQQQWIDCLERAKDVSVTKTSVLSIAAVFRSIDILCGFSETTRLYLYEILDGEDKRKATDHPAYSLTRFDANIAIQAGVWRSTMMQHALTCHGGFSEIIRNAYDEPIRLVPLDPDFIGWGQLRDEESGVDDIAFFKFDPEDLSQKPALIMNRNMWHLKGVSADAIMGLDRTKAMREEFALIIGRRRHAKKFYLSGASVSGFFMLPEGKDADWYANFFEELGEQVDELRSMGFKVAPLFDNVKFQPITQDAERAQLTENMKLTPLEVGTIYGVPPHLLGDTSRTSLRSLEEENRKFFVFTNNMWFVRQENECDKKFLTDEERKSERYEHKYKRERLLQGDMKSTHDTLRLDFHGGGLGWKEYRKALDRPTETDDTFFLPANVVGANPTDPSNPEPDKAQERPAQLSGPYKIIDGVPVKVELFEDARGAFMKLAFQRCNWLTRHLVNESHRWAAKHKSRFDEFLDDLATDFSAVNTSLGPLIEMSLVLKFTSAPPKFCIQTEAAKLLRAEFERTNPDKPFQARIDELGPEIRKLGNNMATYLAGKEV